MKDTWRELWDEIMLCDEDNCVTCAELRLKLAEAMPQSVLEEHQAKSCGALAR